MEADIGLFVLRVGAGIAIMTHGIPKLRDIKGTSKWMRSIGFPSIAGPIAAIVETFGGLLLILGIFTPIVAAVLTLNLAGALFYHLRDKQTFKQMEDAFLFFIIFIALILAGGGAFQIVRYSLF